MDNRGEINNRARAKQLNNFGNFVIGDNKTITPTDVDGLIEYQSKCFVLIEVKYLDAPFRRGQRIAFEQLAKSIRKPVIIIVAYHEVEDTEQDVIVATTDVKETFLNINNTWTEHKKGTITTKRMVDKFIKKYGG